MLFISYGMPKSASSFAFLLAHDIANTVSDQQKLLQLLPKNLRAHFHDHFNSKADVIDKCIPDDQLLVIKTHDGLLHNLKEKILTGRMMASVSYRDPYDIVVSLLDAGERERARSPNRQRSYFANIRTIEDALALIPNYLAAAESWLKHVDSFENCITIEYDEVKDAPFMVADRIASLIDNSLGLDHRLRYFRAPRLSDGIIKRHLIKCLGYFSSYIGSWDSRRHNSGHRLDTTDIVSNYLQGKDKIWEFNVGQSGRGSSEIKIPENHPVKSMMDEFIMKYMPEKMKLYR